MQYLMIWAWVFTAAATIASGVMNGFAGAVATFLAMPALICLGYFSAKGGPMGGSGTAVACGIGAVLVAGLLEIIVPGLGTKVFGVWGGCWDWFWDGGYWLVGGLVLGSFILTLIFGALSNETSGE